MITIEISSNRLFIDLGDVVIDKTAAPAMITTPGVRVPVSHATKILEQLENAVNIAKELDHFIHIKDQFNTIAIGAGHRFDIEQDFDNPDWPLTIYIPSDWELTDSR